MARTVGIGVQDFDKIIENNYFYVDKTQFIKEWWENGDDVTLITRPRRFGKTLTMSMMEHFFSIRYSGCASLFKKLVVWQEEKYRGLQGTYPVISLSFANVKEDNHQDTYKAVCSLITREYNRCLYLLSGKCFSQPEKDIFYQIASGNMQRVDAVSAINRLSEYLCRYYGKRVIILLDEYDTPLHEAYVKGYWDESASFMKRIFHASFKTNPWLERAILTGITRVSKESVFSDLNNLEIVTTTSCKYETAFGFTEDEIRRALIEFGLSDKEQEVKRWYDGFRFGGQDNIYNPWSVINFLNKNRFEAYWANTSSNSLAGKLVRKGDPDIKLIMEDLMLGKTFEAQIDEEIIFKQLDKKKNAVWSLLLASGYLKVTQIKQNRRGKKEYTLAFTNMEVRMMFDEIVMDWFSNVRLDYNEFSDALLSNNVEFMNAYINEIAEETFSSFDTGIKPSEFKQPENFYHGFTLGLIADLRNIYRIVSNRESGLGRYDVMLEPFDPALDDGIILEFKVQDSRNEKSLQDTVNAALRQIIDKKYAAVLASKGIPMEKIRIYGFAFRGKKIMIDGGYISGITSNFKNP